MPQLCTLIVHKQAPTQADAKVVGTSLNSTIHCVSRHARLSPPRQHKTDTAIPYTHRAHTTIICSIPLPQALSNTMASPPAKPASTTSSRRVSTPPQPHTALPPSNRAGALVQEQSAASTSFYRLRGGWRSRSRRTRAGSSSSRALAAAAAVQKQVCVRVVSVCDTAVVICTLPACETTQACRAAARSGLCFACQHVLVTSYCLPVYLGVSCVRRQSSCSSGGGGGCK